MATQPACIVLLLALLASSSGQETDGPDPANFLVYGAGMDARKTMPVRYIFVQLRNTKGAIVDDNQAPPEQHDPFLRMDLSEGGRPVRFNGDTLKLNRLGLYLLRFRLRESVIDAALHITYFGMAVANSPYRLSGEAEYEDCDCPNFSLDEWIRYFNCDTNHSQIFDDFKRFDRIEMPIVQREIDARFTNAGAYAFCRYIIKQNQLFRKCFGEHTGFTFMSDPMLLSLMRKMRLPDLDFVLNLGDWPLSQLSRQPHLPIISWCGSESTADITLPTYEMIQSTNEMLDRVYTDVFRVMHDSLHYAWETKVERGFFRGRDSNERRLELVRKSVREPDNIDARLTNMFFFKNENDLGEVVKHVPLSEFFRFKYQISIDGTVAAYRMPYLLAGGSPVLKQQSQYYEHFYKQLVPDKHFVPLSEDLSNLDEKLAWLRRRDSTAKRIASEARQFVLHNLLPEHIMCYQAAVLQQYAARLSSSVTVPQGFLPVTQPAAAGCKCSSNAGSRDEL